MNVYAVISGGVIENTVLWDGQSDWTPPDGRTIVRIDILNPVPGVGWTYNGSTFSPPTPPTPAPNLQAFSDELMTSQNPPTNAEKSNYLQSWLAALGESLAANDLVTITNGWAADKASGVVSTATIDLIISLAAEFNIPGIS